MFELIMFDFMLLLSGLNETNFNHHKKKVEICANLSSYCSYSARCISIARFTCISSNNSRRLCISDLELKVLRVGLIFPKMEWCLPSSLLTANTFLLLIKLPTFMNFVSELLTVVRHQSAFFSC